MPDRRATNVFRRHRIPTTSSNGRASARVAFCIGYDCADTQRLAILRAFPEGLRSLQPHILRAESAL
jgi:hypothetical protein